MNSNKDYSNYLHSVIVITFITIILIISSTELSFAKKDNKNEDYDKDLDSYVSSKLKDKNNLNSDLKDPDIQNDELNGKYPDQFFICGYPQQVITDYNFFDQTNCN